MSCSCTLLNDARDPNKARCMSPTISARKSQRSLSIISTSSAFWTLWQMLTRCSASDDSPLLDACCCRTVHTAKSPMRSPSISCLLLEKRVARLGSSSRPFKEWMAAHDTFRAESAFSTGTKGLAWAFFGRPRLRRFSGAAAGSYWSVRH